jgi:hypothetical protein
MCELPAVIASDEISIRSQGRASNVAFEQALGMIKPRALLIQPVVRDRMAFDFQKLVPFHSAAAEMLRMDGCLQAARVGA